MAIMEVTGLTAGTRYFWQMEDDSVLDTGTTGTFLTHPVAAGRIVFEDTPADLVAARSTLTGEHLAAYTN